MTAARTSAKNTDTPSDSLSKDERAAVKERAKELRATKKAASKAEAEAVEAQASLDKIAELPEAERTMAKRIHEIALSSSSELRPKTYYGMPGWAKGDKIIAWFKPASKFKTRYATLGFSDTAALDDGDLWPTEFAVLKLTKATEARIAELIKRAAG